MLKLYKDNSEEDAKAKLDSLKKELEYILERDHFGAPADCVPKSSIQQIYDAHYGK